MRNVKIALAILVVGVSLALGIHNATLYAPDHGFDGAGHVYYIQYLAKHRAMPLPDKWETHQAPLYYVVGAILMTVGGSFKYAQYFNTFVLWLMIAMVGLGLKRVFKSTNQILLGMFALAALPMLNIFPAMVTNELFGTFWSISAAVAIVFLLTAKTNKQIVFYSLWIGMSLALGALTKISIITILPTIFVGYLIYLVRFPKKRSFLILAGIGTIIIFASAAIPILIRGAQSKGPSNVVQTVSGIKQASRDIFFYTRLDWIFKVDMYNTQYYSMLGGAWNSFWSDGHNAITPFVTFHKKALILWLLGFILLPISVYGLVRMWKHHKQSALVVYSVGSSMLAMYVLYNMMSNHYSAVRLTYEMPIVLAYAFGIAGAAEKRKMQIILLILLSIQFITLVSFYWILPWWHVTK